MATKTQRKLTETESSRLSELETSIVRLEGKIRSCDQNLRQFSVFVEECDIELADTGLPDEERRELKSRKSHCVNVQRPNEERVKASSGRILEKRRADLVAEKTRFGPSLERRDDGWYVDG